MIVMRKATMAAALLGATALTSTAADAAGLLRPAEGGLPPLELRDHEVQVAIEDGYAITTVEQVFSNPHDRELEAIYSFPAPEDGSVAELTYWIDGKPVTGEVMPREEARQTYEQEKQAGRETALAEQNEHYSFEASIWPVPAGGDVRVRIAYMQPVHVDTSVGRYVYPLQENETDTESLKFWTRNEEVTGRFSFDLVLRSGYPVETLRLPQHPQAQITQTPDGEWLIHMDNGVARIAADAEEGQAIPAALPPPQPAVTRLDTDVVVYWRLQDGLPGTVDMVAYKPEADGRGTFMLTVTPGEDLKPITEGRDWVFVLDKSGSMSTKFATLTQGVEQGLRKMRPEDRFRIVLFDETAYEITSGFQSATPQAIDQAIATLHQTAPDDGTNLYAGLDLGLSRLDADRSSGVILVTDGEANVGVTQTKEFVDLVESQDVRLFTMVMGNGANRPLLEQMAKASGGTAISVSTSDDVVGAVMSATSKIAHEALHDVSLSIDGVRVADLAPETIGSLYRGQQLVLFGHYWDGGTAEVTLEAKISGQPKTYKTRFDFPEVATRNPEIERLWAFAAVEGLMEEIDLYGETADRRQAVVDVAVDHGLVTEYTSMVVLREDVFEALGVDRANQRRLRTEAAAQAQRATQPVQQTRVDAPQPMFQGPRPSYSGGGGAGSAGLVGFALAALAAAFGRRALKARA